MTGYALQPLDIPRLLRQYQIHPSKGLGQNFLISEKALRKIISAAEIQEQDDILEIGPGLGSLTRHLAERAHSVVAVELDRKMFPVLQKVLASYKNVHLFQGDILKVNPAEILQADKYIVVANIPYYITSNVIRHLLEGSHRPRRMVLTVQKEVAERICAGPGDMSILAISVQVFGNPTIIDMVPAGAFYPSPDVDSSILRIDIFPKPTTGTMQIDQFFKVVKAGFSQKRKTLRNSLSSGLGIPTKTVEEKMESIHLDPKRRAETLALEEWEKLTSVLV